MLYKKFIYLFISCIISCIISCTSYSKKGFKRLDVYSKIYETNMNISVELYKNNMITEEEKIKIKKLGVLCWATYGIAVDSLKVYINTNSDKDKIIFRNRMKQYLDNFNSFIDYASLLFEKYNIKNVNKGNWKYYYFEDFKNSDTLSEALEN